MKGLKSPPMVGDKVVVGKWHVYKSYVSCVEDEPGGRVLIHITTEYPDDPYFKRKKDTCKVWLHDEGDTWHRADSYPHVN